MSDTPNMSKGGEFATGRRGGIAEDVEFIRDRALAGVPASAIARMIGRSEIDVRNVLNAPVAKKRPHQSVKARELEAIRLAMRDRKNRASPMPLEIKLIYQRLTHLNKIKLDDLLFSAARSVQPARYEAYAIAYRTGEYSSPQISRWFGLLDHTAVLAGCRAHQARVRGDTESAAEKLEWGAQVTAICQALEAGELDSAEIAKAVGTSRAQAAVQLSRLKGLGLVAMTGKRRNGRGVWTLGAVSLTDWTAERAGRLRRQGTYALDIRAEAA